MVILSGMKHILLVGIAAFLFLNSFGITHLGMSINADGQTSTCPFMGVPALCHMNPLDHIFTVQTMLVTIPAIGTLFFLISLLCGLIAFPVLRRIWQLADLAYLSSSSPPPILSRYVPRHALQEAFASGIIHSKAF